MKKVGLMFAGQGAQFVGMGADLFNAEPTARKIFENAEAELGTALTKLCFDGPEDALTDTANCQPAIYTMSIACLETLREKAEFEIVAGAGLSLGEFSALHATGGCDFNTGLKLLQQRGNLMAEACSFSSGGMAAVLNADPDQVAQICENTGIDVANYNCPGQIVVSGTVDKLKMAIAKMKEANISKIIELQVAGAFHSRCMQSAADAFEPTVDAADIREPECAFLQNYTGKEEEDPADIRANLKAQITGSVKWEQCVRQMMNMDIDALIEIGPGKVLTGFVKRIDRKFPVLTVGTLEQLEQAAQELAK